MSQEYFKVSDPVQVNFEFRGSHKDNIKFAGRYGEISKIVYPEKEDEHGKKIPKIEVSFSDGSVKEFHPWDLTAVVI